jgi:hypothetical protein
MHTVLLARAIGMAWEVMLAADQHKQVSLLELPCNTATIHGARTFDEMSFVGRVVCECGEVQQRLNTAELLPHADWLWLLLPHTDSCSATAAAC